MVTPNQLKYIVPGGATNLSENSDFHNASMKR